MTPLLISLLKISLLMSLTALVLHLIMNLFSKSISPKWKYYIWGIVLISFLIPFRPKVAKPIVTVDAPNLGSVPASGTTETGAEMAASNPSFWQQIDIPTLLLGVWIAGVIIFLAIAFIKHMRFMKTAKRWGSPVSEPQTVALVHRTMEEMNIVTDIKVIKSKMISVPMMAGIFKPVLFLPVYDLDEEELKYVIRHELIHYRKFDIFIKLLSVLANAVHWFNPLVYVMQRWIHTDCEVACDYEVTKSYEKDERIRYVETIIGVAKHEIRYKTVFSTNFYDGKKTMKKRLESVLSDYKMRGALVIILVAAVAITSIAAGSALAVSTSEEKASPPKVATTEGAVKTEEPTKSTDSAVTAGSTEPAINENTDEIIDASEAKKIALNRSGGGKVTECTLDSDDGQDVYDITIINGNYEYEIEVDAKTGNIIDYDKEKIEHDHGHDD